MTDLTKNDDSFDSEADSDTFYEEDLTSNQNKSKDFLKKESKEIEINNIITAISEIFKHIVENNNEQPLKKDFLKKQHSILYSGMQPKISLYDYVYRIKKNIV